MSISTTEHDTYLVENWDTETLVLHLQEQGLKLDDEDFAIIRKEKIDGQVFLDMTEEKFRSYGLAGGPAMKLTKEAKALKTMPIRPFSSYNSLKEVLAKYGIDDNRITTIPQFTPDIHKLDDNDEEFLHCIKEIKHRLGNMGTVADSNEVMRCSYIESILHASVRIVMHLTEKGLILIPQLEVSGSESHDRVDYAIKKILDTLIEKIICITECKQNQAGVGIAQNLMQCESSEQLEKEDPVRYVDGSITWFSRCIPELALQKKLYDHGYGYWKLSPDSNKPYISSEYVKKVQGLMNNNEDYIIGIVKSWEIVLYHLLLKNS
ncbi:15042_t:CDS:2 [Acaulospora morrowiae]|uniref:15042_t:CDS:1 n=1 Tax=Acaulospora morrowiae TaxID=94023 RepID=A0A9N9FJL5_9GLOM|nr:15042_t:CDS:2 [Acaulospora morrowiae]